MYVNYLKESRVLQLKIMNEEQRFYKSLLESAFIFSRENSTEKHNNQNFDRITKASRLSRLFVSLYSLCKMMKIYIMKSNMISYVYDRNRFHIKNRLGVSGNQQNSKQKVTREMVREQECQLMSGNKSTLKLENE